MPEGHTIHRLAREHRRLLGGRRLRVSSPQGRFVGAELVDGRRLTGTDAYGKHLFHEYEGGAIVHVHLGLFGRFRVVRGETVPPVVGQVRMRLRTDDVTVDLSGPTACEVGDESLRELVVSRLGPDPLRRDADPARFVDRANASSRHIGALLLDQAVLAGVGNVYRAEALFVHGIHPMRDGRALGRDELVALWDTIAAMLAAGVRAGRIVTVDRAELGLGPRTRIRREDATYVYHRDRCLRCGSAIQTAEVGGRTCWFCPVDQPA